MNLVTLSSDFAVQSYGTAIMEAVVREINPSATVIHFTHGLPSFDIRAAAKVLEALTSMPIGIHVCVVDPGVGTERKPIIIQCGRGDFLVGPDNGVLLPAARELGDIVKAVSIDNRKFYREPVSNTFHGRDIFSPAAAWLSKGIALEQFGTPINNLFPAPYTEAIMNGNSIEAEVIFINKFGCCLLNITHKAWDEFGASGTVELELESGKITAAVARTYGDVPARKPLILKDEFNRIELATNQVSFAEHFQAKMGDKVTIRKAI